MSLNLANISETASRLQTNTSNDNIVQSNLLKLERGLRDIQEESRKLQDEKTKLRRLKKEIDAEKQEVQTQKTSIQNQQEMIRHQMAKHKSAKLMVTESNLEQRKEHRSLQRTLGAISMELTATKRKLMSEQRKGHGDKDKKLKIMQRRYNAEKKSNKLMKRELDAVLAELAIAKRKLLTAQRKGGKGDISSAKYKALLRKWMKARKKLKLALMEFEDRANFYRRREAAFKKQQKKWLRQQKATLKNKKTAVKYAFIDDIAAIVINNQYKNKIKVTTRNGRSLLVNNVRVIYEKTKKKKGKKGGNQFIEDASWLEQDQIVQQLMDDIEKEDEYESSFFQTELAPNSDDDDEFEDVQVIRGDVMDWKDEMMQRNEDMKILMSIALNSNGGADISEHLNFDDLITGIVERNRERYSEMEGDRQLDKDLEDQDGELKESSKRKNHYDESMKLLKTNCEEYIHNVQDAISNIQEIVETNNVSKVNSIIQRKSMQASSQQSLLAPSPMPSSSSAPTLMNALSPSSVSLADMSQFSDDHMTMFNPYTIAEQLSTFYMDELDARNKDIKLMIDIFYSSYNNADNASLKNLDDIMRGIDFRIDDVEDNDALVMKYISNMENWKIQFQQYAMGMALLMQELSDRREEMNQIFDVVDISQGNKALMNRIESLSERIDIRHENVAQIMDSARYEVMLGAKIRSGSDEEDDDDDDVDYLNENDEKCNDNIDLGKILENVNGLENENTQWKDFMDKLCAEANKEMKDTCRNSKARSPAPSASFKIIENCINKSMKEIDTRTGDIEKLKFVLLSKDSVTAGELLNQIEDRHNELNKANDDIIKSHEKCREYCVSEENNSLWWKAVEGIVLNNKIMKKKRSRDKGSDKNDDKHHQKKHRPGHDRQYESTSLSLMRATVPTAVTPIVRPRSGTIRGVDYNENLKFVLTTAPTPTPTKEKQTDDYKLDEIEEDDGWWLMLDENRNVLLEGFDVTRATSNTLSKLAVYVSRILKSEASSDPDKVMQLYIAIDLNAYPSSSFCALASLFDGVVISKLLSLINEDCIDFRAIHKPDVDEAFPLKKHEINENISVILSSLKSMGISLSELYSIADWWNPGKHCSLLINLLREIASHTLDRFCSYKKHPELLLLKKKTETRSSLSYFAGEKWMIRWVNYMLNRRGMHNANIDNDNLIKFNKDLMRILAILNKRSSILLNKPNATKSDNAKAFICIAKTSFNITTPIEAQDFTSNNRFCQNYFAAQIFDKCNGLILPSDMEHNTSSTIDDGFDEGEREAIIAWLNSFGLRNRVDSLDGISSGVTLLKVLDRLKKGVVLWKKVHLKVRHKFDHVINCNYVVDICSKQLGLKFVNISGMDIVENNTQIIASIFWRIMRYQSIKILSDLQFGSNISKVNNDVIVKWCNDKLHSVLAADVRCKPIKRLNAQSLTTGIYYLELIRAAIVMRKAINDDLIHFNVPPLSSSIKKDYHLHDKYYKKRKQNLKYAMTIIRRYGVDLFINVEDLFRLESRAVVSILAAVMTISLSTQHIKKGENINAEKHEKKNNKTKYKQISIKEKNKKSKKSKSKKNEPQTPLKMENVDDIDIDSVLDSVESLYKK